MLTIKKVVNLNPNHGFSKNAFSRERVKLDFFVNFNMIKTYTLSEKISLKFLNFFRR